MATKNNPGAFDCYHAAALDEPIFTLRANDELAPHIVRIWASARANRGDLVMRAMQDLRKVVEQKGPHNQIKIDEAIKCADDMIEWKMNHPG